MTNELKRLSTETSSRRDRNEQRSDEHTETTTTGSNADDPTTKPVTDGGTEDIRSRNEVEYSDDEVRRYSADGHLYAYRDGDEHVVVARGNEPQTRWTKRVPAERDAVLAGEHLWTIPDNWDHRVKIDGAGEARYGIYHIPETDVDVLVTVPRKTQLVDAWYEVKRVGTLNVTYDDQIDWDKLETTIEELRDIDDVNERVVTALETLHRRRQSFERTFAEEIERDAPEVLFERGHTPVPISDWTTAPWSHSFHTDDLVQDHLDLDNETRDAVVRKLSTSNAVPTYPTVRVDVDEDKGVPDGYDIRALVETGASGPETIDYLITEHYDDIPQIDWAEHRNTDQRTIRRNVDAATKALTD